MARRIGAVKNFIELWQCHEDLYHFIFLTALERLKVNKEQCKNEDAISEALCPVLNDVCFEHVLDVKIPDWEKPIQPLIIEDLKGGKVRKRPDFTCTFVNSLASCPEMYEIPFHVECKRLGKTIGTWNLNKNYVNNGIKRFDSKSHEYGKRALSGMMIGYILNMEPTSILKEVNQYLSGDFQKLRVPFIVEKTVSYEQNLIRKMVKPNEIKLIHLWVDLRN